MLKVNFKNGDLLGEIIDIVDQKLSQNNGKNIVYSIIDLKYPKSYSLD